MKRNFLTKNSNLELAAVCKTTDYTLLQSQTIDWLRFPLCIVVVFIHNLGYREYQIPIDTFATFNSYDLYNLIRITFSNVLTKIAVPVFFVISGYLFFSKIEKWNYTVYLKKIKTRFKTLFIPYILWNSLFIVITILLKFYAFRENAIDNIILYFNENKIWNLYWECNIWNVAKVNWLGSYMPETGPANLSLWYLRNLIVVILFTPLVYIYIKKTKLFGMIILALAYITGIFINIPGISITAFFFFILGAYMSLNKRNIVLTFRKIEKPTYFYTFIFLILTIIYDGLNTKLGNIFFPFYIIGGVICAFNIASRLLEANKVRVNRTLAKSSFFIYCIHLIYINYVSEKVIDIALPGDSFIILLMNYIAKPLLTVLICLTIYILMRKYTPKLLNIFMGGR